MESVKGSEDVDTIPPSRVHQFDSRQILSSYVPTKVEHCFNDQLFGHYNAVFPTIRTSCL